MAARKTQLEKFISSKFYRSIANNGFLLTDELKTNITKFYEYFSPDTDRYCRWQQHIARWIESGVNDDWIERRLKIMDIPKGKECSIEWYTLTYGDIIGKENFFALLERKKAVLPTSVEYWTKLGYSIEDAKIKIAEHQSSASKKRNKMTFRETSIRCVEYWTSRGYSETEATQMVSLNQRRDLSFYQRIYGVDDGYKKFVEIKNKKIKTWSSKSKEELKSHAVKTLNGVFGQAEQKAICMFLEQNNISPAYCKFGTPREQFYQYIPDVGYRRYDLAVFQDIEHKNLKYIFEYHGLGHINFSDYDDSLENVRFNINGKEIPRVSATFGYLYNNDMVKRNHILNKYPNVTYIVAWPDDINNKRLKIDELLQRSNNRD